MKSDLSIVGFHATVTYHEKVIFDIDHVNVPYKYESNFTVIPVQTYSDQ